MPEPENQPGNGGQGNAGVAPAAGDPAKAPETPKLTMTQEELDRIIADRLARAKPKDYDDLVALRDKVTADANAKKDELTLAKEAQATAEAAAKTATERANATLRRAAIIAEAATQNAVDADMVATLLTGDGTITVEEDGTVKGVKQAVKKLLEEKKFLAKGAASTSGGEFGGNDKPTLQEQIAAAETAKDFALARRLKIQGLAARG